MSVRALLLYATLLDRVQLVLRIANVRLQHQGAHLVNANVERVLRAQTAQKQMCVQEQVRLQHVSAEVRAENALVQQ